MTGKPWLTPVVEPAPYKEFVLANGQFATIRKVRLVDIVGASQTGATGMMFITIIMVACTKIDGVSLDVQQAMDMDYELAYPLISAVQDYIVYAQKQRGVL